MIITAAVAHSWQWFLVILIRSRASVVVIAAAVASAAGGGGGRCVEWSGIVESLSLWLLKRSDERKRIFCSLLKFHDDWSIQKIKRNKFS